MSNSQEIIYFFVFSVLVFLGEIKDHSINISLAKNSLPKTNLLFPGKISLNESGDQLAISDTGHHQILLVDVGGNVMSTVGKGIAGLVDGDFKVAQFNSPQGVAWHGNQILYVADTENHAIRKVYPRIVNSIPFFLSIFDVFSKTFARSI